MNHSLNKHSFTAHLPMFRRLPKKQPESKPQESLGKVSPFGASNSSQKQGPKFNSSKLKTSDLPQFAENRVWTNSGPEKLNESPLKTDKQRALLYHNFLKNQLPVTQQSTKVPTINWNFNERELRCLLNLLKPDVKPLPGIVKASQNSLKATGAIPFKKIQKPFSTKKLTAFWLKKTQQTPVIFRKVRPDFQQNQLVEHHDLIKASAKYRFKV